MAKQGWFTTKGREGDRTLKQQLVGLDKLLDGVAGKTVLDVGCAEGLISVELAKRGATHVLGLEILRGHVDVARRHAVEQTEFVVGDATSFNPKPNSFDVVLLLAILHKLKDPIGTTQRLANAAKSLVVVRLPPAGPVFVDGRSGNKPQNITATLEEMGFHLESDSRGTFDEWIGFYRRNAEVSVPAPVAWSFPTEQQQEQVLQPEPAPEVPPPPAEPAPQQEEPVEADASGEQTVDQPSDFIEHVDPTVDMTSLPNDNEPTATDGLESGRELYPEPRRRRARRTSGDQGGTT